MTPSQAANLAISSSLSKNGGDVNSNRISFLGEMGLEGPRLQNQSTFLEEAGSGAELKIKLKRGPVEKIDGDILALLHDSNVVLESAFSGNECPEKGEPFYFSFTAIGNKDSSISLDLNVNQARKLRELLDGYLRVQGTQLSIGSPVEILAS